MAPATPGGGGEFDLEDGVARFRFDADFAAVAGHDDRAADVETQTLIEIARQRTLRELTSAECMLYLDTEDCG